jgi:predicted DNA-binding transcriptional regulator AlpA
MTPVLERWRQRAADFEASGLHDFARVVRTMVEDLETAAPENPAIPLTEAVRRTGYSYKHLWRLVKRGRLTNVGTDSAIRVRVAELPKKPGTCVP